MFLTALITLSGALCVVADPIDSSKLPPVSDRKDVTCAKDIKPMCDNSRV